MSNVNQIMVARIDRLERWAWGDTPPPALSPMKVRILITRTIWFWQADRYARNGWTVQTGYQVRHPLNPLLWLELLVTNLWPLVAKSHFEEVP